MITIIAGTNRPESLTLKFATIYKELLERSANEVMLLSLADIPASVYLNGSYEHHSTPHELQQLQEEYFIPAEKYVFIFPEYNGSLPGILKLLIDSLNPKMAFKGKKASLIGIANGRAGNLRGLDHLSSILMHMQVTVLPYLLPVSKVQAEFEENSLKEATLKVVEDHIRRTIEF
ncbi:MAG: NAD(P)H-dependent oxidoreductase [Bacteroidetes bacterium]|nr:NAD(P)H-dependent oxidoreductase [Bacteroidota bacterium]